MNERFFDMSAEEVEKYFDTSSVAGLSTREARKRLKYFGQNKIYGTDTKHESNRILSMIFSPSGLMFYASAAACIALHIGGAALATVVWTVAMVVLAVIKLWSGSVLNAVYSCGIPRARVLRDGGPKLIDSRSLVPGDILLLSEGDIVCADCRIIYSDEMKVREPYGTDDYRTVDKISASCPDAIAPSEMFNMAFASSTVTYGGARAIVTATGRETLVLTDNGGAPLTLRGAHSCKSIDNAKRTEKKLCLISAVSLFLISIVLLVAAPKSPMEYFFTSAATVVFWMCGACGVLSEFAVACTVNKMASDNRCRALVKNIACMDPLADADVLICGEEYVYPYLADIAAHCERYGLRVYISATAESAREIADKCNGILVPTPLDVCDIKGNCPVVAVCRSPADRARLAASLSSAGHTAAAVASKAGHIGMFKLSAVSLCCAAFELSAKKITDISLEDIDRSAGNEAMMKNSDILCRPTEGSVLNSVGMARAFASNVSSLLAYASAVCCAMLVTLLITLFGSSGALAPSGTVFTSLAVILPAMAILASASPATIKRTFESQHKKECAFAVFSAFMWLGALVAVRIFAFELGFDISDSFRGYCTCSLAFFAAVSAPLCARSVSGPKRVIRLFVPVFIAIAAVLFAVFIPNAGDVIFSVNDKYIILLSAIPALFGACVAAVNKAVYLKFNS